MSVVRKMAWRWWCAAVMSVAMAGSSCAWPDKRISESEGDLLPTLTLQPQSLTLEVGETHTFLLKLSKEPQDCINVSFTLSNPVGEVPLPLTLCNGTQGTAVFQPSTNGITTVSAHATPPDIVNAAPQDTFCVVRVMQAPWLTITADVLGWMYTIAWDISFLPQIVHNWRRKSVIGLSFDFLTFNIIGFFSYLIFNVGLMWIDDVKMEYTERHPTSVLQVRLNDVIFPLYAVLCTSVQVMQCFVYKRGEKQRVSMVCRVVSALLVASAVVGCLLVPLLEDWWWLDFLYLLSYLKLAVTAIKYVPQLWVNYSHKSTEGWSIYQVILDFTGGSLSLLQMFLLAANYDDWYSILTDPAKLGLGLLSILFNILFFIQHYVLYRNPPPRKDLKGTDAPFSISDTVSHL